MHFVLQSRITIEEVIFTSSQPTNQPASLPKRCLGMKQFSFPSFFETAVRIHIWLERWWKKKRRRTMTCLLHIRTTTAASPNTKRKERSEDLEECITVAMILSLKFPLFFNVYS